MINLLMIKTAYDQTAYDQSTYEQPAQYQYTDYQPADQSNPPQQQEVDYTLQYEGYQPQSYTDFLITYLQIKYNRRKWSIKKKFYTCYFSLEKCHQRESLIECR